MSNNLKSLVSLSVLLWCLSVTAQTKIQLTENYLQQAALKGAPQIDQIQAAFLGSVLQSGQTNEQFAPEIFGRAAYAETNEKPIITFIPIFTPIKQAQIGVRQNLKQGFSAEASVTADQRSASSPTAGKFKDVSTTTLSFTLQMDLWKDLFGRMSKASLESAQLESKRAEIERDIQTKTFSISLRRLYWSLVANQEALTISEQLLKTAQKQAAETNQRFKNSVAESDEVAGYAAQVASRQGTLTFLQFQRETMLKQLRNLLPELTSVEIEMGQYDLDKTFNAVMACTAIIAQQPKIPYEFTRYDEATSLLKKVKSNAAILNSRYADPDVKLYGTVKSTGVGSNATNNGFRGSYGASLDDMQDTNRSGYEVGMRFSVPLGSVKEANQRTKELYDEKRLLAAIQASDAQVTNTHEQLLKSVTLLNDVVKSQKVNSEQLEKRLIFMKRKYEQARASVSDLIYDQDALLSAELTTIDTQLQILNVIFDYLAIYTETPCTFNRI